MIKGKRGSSRSWTHVWMSVAILFVILLGLWLANVFLNRREFFEDAAGATKAVAEEPKKKKVVVNYYYLEKCPFCVQFDPEWEKFVTLSAGKVETNKIDGTKQERYKSFPTVEVIEEGAEPREYTGDRTATAMMDYLNSAE